MYLIVVDCLSFYIFYSIMSLFINNQFYLFLSIHIQKTYNKIPNRQTKIINRTSFTSCIFNTSTTLFTQLVLTLFSQVHCSLFI